MSSRRLLAAAAAMGLLAGLSSCITVGMWDPVRQPEARELPCASAVAGAGTQLAFQLDEPGARAIGVEPSADGRTWIVLQPDDPTVLDAFRQRRDRRDAEQQLIVTFSPASAPTPRRVQLRLSSTELLVTEVGDRGQALASQLRQDRGPRAPCTWHSEANAPAGEILSPPMLVVYDWRDDPLSTPAKVALTPLTAACDLVFLPFEIVGSALLWLAD